MQENRYGVSFSVKQCRNFDLPWQPVLESLIVELGVRRFRLMSYWDEIEKSPGEYDFLQLDIQIAMIEAAKGEVSLCLGARQPRWPENHWPDWAWELPKSQRDEKLLEFIKAVVKRYKDNSTVTSYQLENEALLTNFGERPDTDRNRLLVEYATVKNLDSNTPVVMTTSTSWGIPIRQPIPDIVGFSYYQVLFNNNKYGRSFHRPWLDRVRAWLVKILHGRPSFIHELQAEPWGPKNIWDMTKKEQDKSMSLSQLQKNIEQAKRTGLYPIDFWGAEWWYWLKTTHHDPTIWQTIEKLLKSR